MLDIIDKNLTFQEWLQKKPYNDINHYHITYEWGELLAEWINNEKDLELLENKELFIRKFQYFLYKNSLLNINSYKYYE